MKKKTKNGQHVSNPKRQVGISARWLFLAGLLFSPASAPLLWAQDNATPQASTSTTKEGKRHYIAGVVVDENNEPLPGVTLSIKESSRKGLTNLDGSFNLWLDEHEITLVASFIGMQPQEINTLKKNNVRIKLVPEENFLKDVVVTGYQTISKERATGSFDVITPESMKGKLQTNIISRLEGQTAGLVQQDGNFFIRGIATLRGGAEGYKPLIVVDGLPFEGELESINPSTIKNVTVLKDAAAASIYGARAANGVIVISTIDGSNSGRVSVRYDASVKFTPKMNLESLNRLTSSELVDVQAYGFQFHTGTYGQLSQREYTNPVLEQLYKHKAGLITDAELATQLNYYKGLDNRSQLEDFYTRTGVLHQHNLSVSGGNECNRYALTFNYMGDAPTARYQNEQRYGFTLRDNINFFKWMSADIGVATSFLRGKGDSGMGNYYDAYTGYPSYYMLKDASGNVLNIPQYKSEAELQRLQSIGLMDETYSPITNRNQETYTNNENYYRLQFGLNFKLTQDLNLDVKFQSENTTFKNENEYGKNSYYVRSMVNNAAQYDSSTDELTLNVPQGGQLAQRRGDINSYTFRAQINFMKELDKHYITAIGGAERRQVKTTSTATYYMGYDHNSLGYKLVDPLSLNPLAGTQALGGSFSWDYTDYNYLYEREDRYVSFYANASYAYDNRYDITGSIRIDQSNLFGTDPKYQYRPLWSLGGSWHAHQESFMKSTASWLNNLTLRLTYGIGGNVPKDAGPYLTLYALKYNSLVNDFGASIKNPANPTLRWEKTATVNLGLDFAVFKNRLSGSIDFYNKRTTDLLAYRSADPTLGWQQVMLNYGTMYNRGIELALNSRNIDTKDWKWQTSFTFGYNKNKLTDVEDANATVFNYSNGYASVKGYPVGAVFSHRFAGLSATDGTPLYYTNDGTGTTSYVSSIEDLEYSGTRVPKFNGSLSNTISYKNFDLSFMIVYYGGHVLRNEAAAYLAVPPQTNIYKDILYMWRQPGDELNKETTPAMTGAALNTQSDLHPWYTADRHVLKADYMKLRDLSLTYNFNKQLIAKWGLTALALTIQAQNLLTWTANKQDVDPEAMTTSSYGWGVRNYKIPATWTIGISANF